MPHHLATYQSKRGPRAALVIGDALHDLADLAGRDDLSSVLSVLSRWDDNRAVLADLAASAHPADGMPLASATLLCPILHPPAVFCAGANFPDHVANMATANNLPIPESPKVKGIPPFHFLKASRCCVGTGAEVAAPSHAFDYEVELVVVIGREGRNVAVEDALDHVAGYMVGNDLSARDLGFRRQLPRDDVFFHSWFAHKSFDRSAPVGPWLTPADQLPGWPELRMQTRVNGELRQDGLCAPMWYTVEEQIAYLSTIVTLMPGDVIFTGTPGGAGAETGRFLKAGDTVEVSIEGIGKVVTPIV